MAKHRVTCGYVLLGCSVALSAVVMALGLDFPESLAILIPLGLSMWLLDPPTEKRDRQSVAAFVSQRIKGWLLLAVFSVVVLSFSFYLETGTFPQPWEWHWSDPEPSTDDRPRVRP